jgi:xylulokinase
MDAILAVDLGGTSLRAGLVNACGDLVAVAAHSHRIREEADPEDWWSVLPALIAALPCDTHHVAAISLCGFTRSQVLVDAQAKAVRPAQCFPDGRAGAEAAALAGVQTGTWVDMNAWHPLARLRWAQTHDAAAFARARFVLQPKDFLGLRLTGRAASDRIANAWALDRMTGRCASAPWHRAGLDPALMPDLLDPQDRLGEVQAISSLRRLMSTPVFTGSMDSWCATIGAGAVRPGGAYIVSGTTDVCGVFATAPSRPKVW